MKTITLVIDDFSPKNHRFDVIKKLRDRFPELKITMMTVPWDIRYELDSGGTPINDPQYSEWANLVKHGVEDGWLEIGLHGFTHAPNEFEDVETKMFEAKLSFAEEMFKSAGIKLAKVFKNTAGIMDDRALKVLEKNGYGVFSEEGTMFNWNIGEDFPVELDNVVGYGIVHDINHNGLGESLANLVFIPDDYKFKFLSEVL